MVVDADTHVAESNSMWQMLDHRMYPRRPLLVKVPGDTLYGDRNAFWLIDGSIYPKPKGKGSFRLVTPSESDFESHRTDIQIACREITDVPARMRDMDALKVDVQVVYPTLFLVHLTDDVELEVALCRAYNRWLARGWAESQNRLRWVVVPPLRDVQATIDELRYGKEHGAVGVFFKGMERDRTLDDPYFFPVYEEAARLGLPVCIHTAAGSPVMTNLYDIDRNSSFAVFRIHPLLAFRDLVANRVPERFPDLRWGIIEAGASWVPFVLHNLKRSSPRFGERHDPALFRDYNFYIACEADEDIPYLLNYIGEDQLIIGSDYGHNDPSEERQLVAVMRAREDLPERVVDKILGENARTFYGL